MQAIREELFLDIHGLQQWVSIRGAHAQNPVLLVLPGPGATLSPLAALFERWESTFTVVRWDQPLAGQTYSRNGSDIGDYSVERLARDGIALAEYLHRRLAGSGVTPRIVPLAFSAGSITALHMLKRRPDLFAAYVGTGQIVSWQRQDALSYSILLERLRAAGQTDAVRELESIGPPPYADTATDAIKSKYSGAYTAAELRSLPAPNPATAERDFALIQEIIKQATAAYDRLRPQIVAFDADTLGMEFAVPMLFLQGEDDLLTVTAEVASYARRIRAPHSQCVLIPGGGHSPWLMPEYFTTLSARLAAVLAEPR